MTTTSEIITRAAKALGYLGRTEVLSAGDANDGIVAFNALLDSWSNEAMMAYVRIQRSFPLVVGTQTYTIGTGGVINTSRPNDILSAFIRDSNNIDYPMEVIPQQQWDDIGQKGITSQIPTTLFYYSTHPLGVINIFPVPLLNYTVFYTSTLDQVDSSSLITPIDMPPGYDRAFVLNLALEMMNVGFPCMLDDKPFAALTNNASEAKANVKRANTKLVLASYDPAIVSRSKASYNIYSDGPTRGG